MYEGADENHLPLDIFLIFSPAQLPANIRPGQ